jgi:hypothetical protein
MPANVPLIGRWALIQINAVTVGYAQNFALNLSAEKIKEYALLSAQPAVFSSGNQTLKFTMTRLYIDATYQNLFLAATSVTIIMGPAGTSVGNPKITLNGCILDTSNMKVDQKGVVGEDLAGEAQSITVGTW